MALVVALMSLAGCGRGQDPAIDVPTSQTGPDAPGPTSTTAPGSAPEGASTAPVSTPPSDKTLLTGVRVARQPEGDRVVFEFDGPVPGHLVHFVDEPITEDGSGDEVQVEGQAHIEVRMEAASAADLQGEEVRQTYAGPRRVAADTDNITETVLTGDFEAVLTWVIGVERKTGFRVSTLQDPSRLMIEVAR